MKFNGTVNVYGNAYIYNGSVMTLTGATTFNGTVYHDDLSSVVLKSATANVQSMTSTELALRDDVIQLGSAAAALTATQPVDPLSPSAVDLSRAITYVADPNVKTNVISVRNVSLGSGQSVAFTGTASSVFVLKVSGTASFGDGIILNGVLPSHLLVYIGSADSSAAISVGGSSGVAGTFLAPQRALSFSGQGSFRGALISGAVASPAIGVGGSGGGTVADFEADAFCGSSGP